MQQTFGLQAADLLAYEMVKELRNQDERPEDQMRWPLDQILSEPESPRGKMLKYNTAEMLQAQAAGQWDRRKGNVLQRNLAEFTSHSAGQGRTVHTTVSRPRHLTRVRDYSLKPGVVTGSPMSRWTVRDAEYFRIIYGLAFSSFTR